MRRIPAVVMLAGLAAAASAGAEGVRCPATRDVWLSAMGKEADYNMGAARSMKLKVWQEFALVDFDVSALAGKRPTEAGSRARAHATPTTPAGTARPSMNRPIRRRTGAGPGQRRGT